MNIITAELLRSLHLDPATIEQFAEAFPDGVRAPPSVFATYELAHELSDAAFDFDFAARHLLGHEARLSYYAVATPAWHAYSVVEAAAYAQYRDAMLAAQQALGAALRPAELACDAARADAFINAWRQDCADDEAAP